MSLPHPQRPTREDFLRVTNSFWDRLRIRFRWFTIRSFRKWNADDISAFITWFLMSQTLWIFVGTTTFFSVIFATANSLRLQENVARTISNYLTKETGITVIFESAIVPKWKDSRISLKNVYISRRPDSVRHTARVSRDYTSALGYDVSGHPANHGPVGEAEEDDPLAHADLSNEDVNYTMFDLNVDTIEVTLSLPQWLDGKGLVKNAVVKGVRGVIDRRSVTWDPDHPLDPALFRHNSYPGDFELEFLQLEDVLVTVRQPGNFRPYTASIFRADIKKFRKHWMFYDFLNAENVVGQFDNCLFSLHTPQSIGRTTEKELGEGKWGRMARLRIDGVSVDHLQSMTTLEGPISWITSGKVDAVLDIKFPRDDDDPDAIDVIIDAIATTVAEHIPGQRELAKPPLTAPLRDEEKSEEGKSKVVIDIDLRFRDIKAAVPIFTNDLSYVNSALIRPIVAFMNANRTLVPIHCRVAQDLSTFGGAWTVTGLTDEIALKVYDALAYHVTQANFNRRIKTVSLWSLQKTAAAILSTIRTMVDPMSVHLKELSPNPGNMVGSMEFASGLAML
ncbi:mitochondrial distribution and morphology protein family 31/32 [Neolentinus lepideus HHB14362 ss-1]|uniref:Mitochondrial distribution and morphology protein family 31/32 n=1 Tax=Neolentinus lepideus HHB14362 ss-1 TaxID=1314782 RepID=A0A165PRJ2_9AGAM|nr:mitochondrial distribution and morphology protein family 31/32 [Neolentinus lepideus HHB14362 ss-1]